nr:hypothetical protein [Tanacetum cinerariifolium]
QPFTTVSKQWLQILTSPHFTDRYRKITILYPHAGIFANHLTSSFECDFVSLDSRLNSKKSTMDHSFGSAEEVDHVSILQSCNGLLLCSGSALHGIGASAETGSATSVLIILKVQSVGMTLPLARGVE